MIVGGFPPTIMLLYGDGVTNLTMRSIVTQLKVFHSKTKDVFLIWVNNHNGKLVRFVRLLVVNIWLNMVIINMAITKRMNKLTRNHIHTLSYHHSK